MSMSDMWLENMVARNMNSSLSWSVLPHLPLLETGKGTANSGKERGKWRRLEACVTCKRCEQASVVLNVQHVQAQKAGGIMAQAATTDMLTKCSFYD